MVLSHMPRVIQSAAATPRRHDSTQTTEETLSCPEDSMVSTAEHRKLLLNVMNLNNSFQIAKRKSI